uniref:Putative hepatoma-derived growth factor-related protein 2-like n=1 Tax=Davidia involucrata TaxID=16924 RepID=A0A5B6Z178_DAVIN
MSKPWGNIGAWAAEAERAEDEEREQAAAAAAAAAAGGGDSQSFPSLKEAVNTKPKKKKMMTLQEFNMKATVGSGGGRESVFDNKGLTPDEMLRLPTGPKERSAEEMQYGRLGGGFSSYGRSGGLPGRMRDRDGDGDSSWGGNRRSYGGFDDDRRGPPSRASDFDQPSRADEVDNWALGKKSLPSFDSGRPSRYSSLGGSSIGGGGLSRADEVDSWASVKKPIPTRSSTFGSSFRDSGPEPDRWTRGGLPGEDRERPRLVLDPRRGDGAIVEPVKTNKPNPFAAARPREEVLAEKGLDWKKLDSVIEAKKSSRPTSSQSSRPSSAQSIRSEGPALQGMEGAVKPGPKVNPFGDAKPREVLLEQKGMNWKKFDLELEHRGVDRPETEAEKILKEEIDHLKKEPEKESVQGSGKDQTSLHDQILCKERDLELLVRELDDKVRFGQKAVERPDSGAGRVAGFPERPPSQSGMFEESRSMEFMERPRSRGTGDVWTRQGNDRRAFQGGREGGFLGNRDVDRPRSRERW